MGSGEYSLHDRSFVANVWLGVSVVLFTGYLLDPSHTDSQGIRS